jgi:hypothetical protein
VPEKESYYLRISSGDEVTYGPMCDFSFYSLLQACLLRHLDFSFNKAVESAKQKENSDTKIPKYICTNKLFF